MSTDRRRQTGHTRTTDAVIEARYWPTEKAYAALAAVEAAETYTGTEQALSTLDAVKRLHDQWGDTRADDLDPLDMWEQLGRVLGVIA